MQTQGLQVEMCYMGVERSKNTFKKTLMRTLAKVLPDYIRLIATCSHGESVQAITLNYSTHLASSSGLSASWTNQSLLPRMVLILYPACTCMQV